MRAPEPDPSPPCGRHKWMAPKYSSRSRLHAVSTDFNGKFYKLVKNLGLPAAVGS